MSFRAAARERRAAELQEANARAPACSQRGWRERTRGESVVYMAAAPKARAEGCGSARKPQGQEPCARLWSFEDPQHRPNLRSAQRLCAGSQLKRPGLLCPLVCEAKGATRRDLRTPSQTQFRKSENGSAYGNRARQWHPTAANKADGNAIIVNRRFSPHVRAAIALCENILVDEAKKGKDPREITWALDGRVPLARQFMLEEHGISPPLDKEAEL